jgi:ribulose-phosphate 3-epimerase
VSLEEVAGDVDFVLVMTVNPGFGAQAFIPRCVPKIASVRALLDAAGNAAPIEVDGGIDTTTARLVVGAGASILVAGNAIFKADDPAAAVGQLRAAAQRERAQAS